MTKGFFKFEGGPTEPARERLYVTINKENVIGLNGNIYRLLGEPPAVYLYYGPERTTIAIEPIEDAHLTGAFPVKKKSTVGWRINSAPFCKHFDIRIYTTERFLDPHISIDGKLFLNLAETVTTRQFRRKPPVRVAIK